MLLKEDGIDNKIVYIIYQFYKEYASKFYEVNK